jgi:hypothetical protein
MLRIGIHIGGRMVVGSRSNVVQGCMVVSMTQQQVRISHTAAQHGRKEQDLKKEEEKRTGVGLFFISKF